MKKIYAIILAAAAVVVAAASCNKIDAPADDTKVSVNITVGDLQPGTRAVKTGWESGDIIHVYLDDAPDYQPDFDLTYNGTKWVASDLSSAVVARLKSTGGYLRGFWEESNLCMSNASWEKSGVSIFFPSYDKYGSTGVLGRLVADFSYIPYTYDGSTITANINSWRFRANLQIVVSGISNTPGRYTLYSDNNCLYSVQLIDTQSGSPYTCYVSYMGSDGVYGRVAGFTNADGVAFVGALGTNFSAGETINFYLIDNTESKTYKFTKTLGTGESLSASESKITAIKIPFGKFSEI